MPTTIEIFCCYAREDQDLMKKLRTHLMPLQRRSLIKLWSDIDINAGDEWEEEIQKHLNTAHMILLLVSPDFMASDYCYSTEMEYALQRHEKQEARVIPIILRPTAWKGAPFDKIQVLPANARPVTDARSWISIDEALNDVTEKIGPIVTELLLPLYIDEAQQLVKNGRQEDALAIYERALRLEPEYVPALYGKGATLFLLKRYEESVTAYDRAIQASAHPDARYHYGKASALRKLKRYEESLAAYDEAIRLNPRRARVYKEKGELLLELERYAEALPVYEQLNKSDPENAAYYVQTGDILLELKRYIEALVVYEKAIQLDPDETYNEPSYHKKGELVTAQVRSGSLKRGKKRMTRQSGLQSWQERKPLFAQGRQVATNAAKGVGACQTAEAAGELWLQFDHAQIALGQIVVKIHLQILQEAEDRLLMFAHPVQQITCSTLFDPPLGSRGGRCSWSEAVSFIEPAKKSAFPIQHFQRIEPALALFACVLGRLLHTEQQVDELGSPDGPLLLGLKH